MPLERSGTYYASRQLIKKVIYMPMTTRELLARLIKCEAGGEGDDGMRAVSSVITNRTNVPNGEFARVSEGGNFRNIIEEAGQFTCLKTSVNGEYNPQNIWNMEPEQIHYDIADWALANNTLNAVLDSLFYFNPYNPQCPPYFPAGEVGVIYNRINNHCFYTPTANYAKT